MKEIIVKGAYERPERVLTNDQKNMFQKIKQEK